MAAVSFDKNRIRVLLLEGVHDSAVAHFRHAGYGNIVQHKSALTGDALHDALRGTPRNNRIASATTSSATLRVLENGALNTGTPRRMAASRST